MVKILIAEDDAVTQKMVSSAVEDMGYVAIISPNGKHAYETLKANEDINLLISDIMMPEMDGKQLIQTLRGDTEFKDLPIHHYVCCCGHKTDSRPDGSGCLHVPA